MRQIIWSQAVNINFLLSVVHKVNLVISLIMLYVSVRVG